jgi:plasmid stabilization system protein ParE
MPNVILHRRAERDIEMFVDSIARRSSVAAAQQWYDRLIPTIQTLQTNPERCPIADEAYDLGFELRFLLHGRKRSIYRILFRIDELVVTVLRVRHAAQDTLSSDDF